MAKISEKEQLSKWIESACEGTCAENKEVIWAYCRYFLRKGGRQESLRGWLRSCPARLFQQHGLKPLKQYSRTDLEKFVDDLVAQDILPLSKKCIMACVKGFFKWYVEYQKGDLANFAGTDFKTAKMPAIVAWMDVPKAKAQEKNLYKDEDIIRVLHYCSVRDACLLSCLFETGCRIRELRSVQIKDVVRNKQSVQLLINHSKTQGGVRSVFLVASIPYLETWLSQHPDRMNQESPVFCVTGRKNNLDLPSYSGLHWCIKTAFDKAGVQFRGFHLFRHGRATSDARSGMGDRMMIAKFGWTGQSKMAGNYSHLSNDDLERQALQQAGVMMAEKKNADWIKAKVCKNCGESCMAHLERCSVCGKAFNNETEMKDELKNTKALLQSLVQEMFFLKRGIKSLQELPEGLVATEKINGRYVVATKEQDSVAEAEYQE